MFNKIPQMVQPLLSFKLREVLNIADVYTLTMLALYSILALIFYPYLNNAYNLILLNIMISIGIISVATAASKFNAGNLFHLFRRIYIVPVIFLIYSQVQHYIRVVNPQLYDDILIRWDHWLFGVNPTQWLGKFSNPFLTEYLQLCYILYFFMPLAHGIEIHFKGSDAKFMTFSAIVLFTFYLSYLLYFIFPAIGPRFTLHDFQMLNYDLPGIFLTDIFRKLLDLGSSIQAGSVLTPAIVNRDCMPSGHTMVTLINIILAFRFKSAFRWVFAILGGSLIISTVYLRYHYVVDVLAGFLLVTLVLLIEPKIRNAIKTMGFKA